MTLTQSLPRLYHVLGADSEPDATLEPEGDTALRLFSDTLTAAQIATLFDRAPDRAYEKGDPISRRRPEPRRKDAFCLWKSGLPRSSPLVAHIAVIARFTEQHQSILEALSDSCDIGWTASHHRYHGRGGFFIPARLLQSFRQLPLHLVFDVYPPTLPYDPARDDDNENLIRRTFVHLRIVSASVSAKEVSTLLETEPSWACERGERRPPDRLPLDGAVWLLDSGMDPDADDWSGLDTIEDFFDAHRDALLSLAHRARISLRIVQASESGQAGVIIPAPEAGRLTQIPIDLAYIVYRPDELPSFAVTLFD